MSETKDKRSLAALLGQAEMRTVDGVELEFRVLGWEDAALAMSELSGAITTMPSLTGTGDVQKVIGNPELLGAWMRWAGQNRECVSRFLELATNFDPIQLKQLPPVQAAQVFLIVVEVNGDFFLQSLPALFAAVVGITGKLRGAIQKAGSQTTSSGSSPQAISSAS